MAARRSSDTPPLPIWLRTYDRSLLSRDLVGGVTAGTVVIPQAMAYATIAGLPVQVGLYTCMVPMVVYAMLGGSRTLSVSTTSTVAALTASSLIAAGVAVDTDGSPGALAMFSIMIGAILLLARLLRLGSVIDMISDATLTGIKVGVGLTVAAGQLPKVLGLPDDPGDEGFASQLGSVISRLGSTNLVSLLFSVVTVLALLTIARLAPRIPGPLVAVVGGIVLVSLTDLDQHGLSLVDRVPSGLPTPVMPDLSTVGGLLPGAFAIAIMVFLETAAVAGTVRRAGEPSIDNDQELVAIGLANLLGGFFRSMPAAGGFSQTAINQEAGARTQLSELVTSAMALACALFLGGVLSYLPEATLACLVIVAVLGLISPQTFVRLWRLGRLEFWVAVVTALFALIFGMLAGVLVGIVLTLIMLLVEINRLTVTELQPTDTEDLRLAGRHTAPRAGLLVLRVDGPLYSGNVRSATQAVLDSVDRRSDSRVVVLDASAVPMMTVMVTDKVIELSNTLADRHVTLWVAALTTDALAGARRGPRWEEFERSGCLFPTAMAAVRAFGTGEGK